MGAWPAGKPEKGCPGTPVQAPDGHSPPEIEGLVPVPARIPASYLYNHESLLFLDPSIIDFEGVDGPGVRSARGHPDLQHR
jgi:hypothetical protein